MPVRARRRARAVRINYDQLRAVPPRFLNEWPQMDVVAVNVRGPGNDVFGVTELLRLGAHVRAVNRPDSRPSSFRANVARQLRRSQPMEKPPIHGSVIELAQGSAIRVGKNG